MSEAIPYLSVSKINVFMRCPLQGKFRYIDKIPEKALGVFLFGKVVHAAIEKALRRVQMGSPLPDWKEMTDWLPDLFASEIKEDEERKTFCGWDWGDEDTLEKQKRDAPALVKLVREDVLPSIKPVMVEEKFNFPLSSKIGEFKIYGVVDLFEAGGMLTDWKTTSKVSANAKKLDIQLPAYTIYTNSKYGIPIGDNDARKIFLVRGSKPKVEAVNYKIHDGHRQWFRDNAARVWQMIEAEAFVGNTGGWWCGANWCAFHAGCQGELA